MPRDPKREPFEQIYGKLEDRVNKLEQGGLSLEDSIALYEEGMTLARACQQRLDEAELKITKLRESFAVSPQSNGQAADEPVEDYEYIDEDAAAGDDEPFG